MKIEVNVITEGNKRRPDYDGGYHLIEDKGDTMIIGVEPNLEERLEQTEQLHPNYHNGFYRVYI